MSLSETETLFLTLVLLVMFGKNTEFHKLEDDAPPHFGPPPLQPSGKVVET